MLSTIVITVIATLAVATIAFVIILRRKNNPGEKFDESLLASWEAIREIVFEAVVKVIEYVELDKTEYTVVENYIIANIKELIDGIDILTDKEKALFTEKRIKALLGKHIRDLYEGEKEHE
jgi:hypothetical protein